MIHQPRGHVRTRCLVWSSQSPLVGGGWIDFRALYARPLEGRQRLCEATVAESALRYARQAISERRRVSDWGHLSSAEATASKRVLVLHPPIRARNHAFSDRNWTAT